MIDFILQSMWKTKFLGMSLEGLFRTPSHRISHHIHIVRTSYSQLLARSGIFCLLVEVVYWPCGLKFEYPMINNTTLLVVELLSVIWVSYILRQPIVVIVYYFQIWNKKKNIISSRAINSHMGLMYIETLFIPIQYK